MARTSTLSSMALSFFVLLNSYSQFSIPSFFFNRKKETNPRLDGWISTEEEHPSDSGRRRPG
uniref:Uncharacterized protein n=1 Tax=Arundo donax TaxID=35708 RepID=A0A0A9H2Q9_ARUDO